MSLHYCSYVSMALCDRHLLIWQVQKHLNKIVGSVAEWLRNSPFDGERDGQSGFKTYLRHSVASLEMIV